MKRTVSGGSFSWMRIDAFVHCFDDAKDSVSKDAIPKDLARISTQVTGFQKVGHRRCWDNPQMERQIVWGIYDLPDTFLIFIFETQGRCLY